MSLPPSALFPFTGVAYQNYSSCYYSVAGADVPNPFLAPDGILPLDAGTGTQQTGFFCNYGVDVGLRPNRAPVAGPNDPPVGALVNTSSFPVYFCGNVIIAKEEQATAYVDTTLTVLLKESAGGSMTVVGKIDVLATDVDELIIPFSAVLKPNDSIFVENGVGQQGATLSAELVNCYAKQLYGTVDTNELPYIPA